MVGTGWRAADITTARERRYHRCRARLASVASALHRPTDTVSIEVRSGTAADEIVDAAIDYGCDVIIMATHGRSGFSHLVLGSVTEAVIRRAPCPVLAVRESGAARVHSRPRVA